MEGVFRKYVYTLDLCHLPTSICQIFDLKGSIRNRHVNSTGKENEVLLDENLVESTSVPCILSPTGH